MSSSSSTGVENGQLVVTIPPGLKPGDHFAFVSPEGNHLKVQVPDNAVAGLAGQMMIVNAPHTETQFTPSPSPSERTTSTSVGDVEMGLKRLSGKSASTRERSYTQISSDQKEFLKNLDESKCFLEKKYNRITVLDLILGAAKIIVSEVISTGVDDLLANTSLVLSIYSFLLSAYGFLAFIRIKGTPDALAKKKTKKNFIEKCCCCSDEKTRFQMRRRYLVRSTLSATVISHTIQVAFSIFLLVLCAREPKLRLLALLYTVELFIDYPALHYKTTLCSYCTRDIPVIVSHPCCGHYGPCCSSCVYTVSCIPNGLGGECVSDSINLFFEWVFSVYNAIFLLPLSLLYQFSFSSSSLEEKLIFYT
mmetsp:Transcript_14504/g.21842  ORF Transcript_14504/g.21842 Transcript_14504/m.21842 type:complete len:363 (+) Transcript_14504:65-1153(+)